MKRDLNQLVRSLVKYARIEICNAAAPIHMRHENPTWTTSYGRWASVAIDAGSSVQAAPCTCWDPWRYGRTFELGPLHGRVPVGCSTQIYSDSILSKAAKNM